VNVSLRLLLLAAFAYVLLLAILALEVPLALNVSRRINAEVKAQAASEAQLVAASASGREGEALDRIVGTAASQLGGRVIVVDEQGRLVSDSAGEGLVGRNYGARPEIQRALATGRTAQIRRDSDTLDQEVLFTAAPVVDEGALGAVRISQSVDAIDDRVRRDVLGLAAVGLAALAFGLLFAWVLASTLSRPLRGLAAAARRVESGDLEARAEPGGASEQREVAEAFNDMTDRLERVLAGQREFVANASHQLRTPLTGLRLRIEAAALKADDPALGTELDAAEREAERLARLVTSLLALAREGEQPGPPRPVALADAAGAAVERWEQQATRSDRRLVGEGDADVVALASEEDVAIVLDNLIENALHYSPPGTQVAVGWRRDADRAVLTVADEGPGLAPGEEATVFERFARGSAGSGASGSGLGLPIVATLARRWGGSAAIRTRPSGGAEARIELPGAPPRPLPTLDRELDRALPGGG
jgi:two-component system, OmpR family, sensor kinase